MKATDCMRAGVVPAVLALAAEEAVGRRERLGREGPERKSPGQQHPRGMALTALEIVLVHGVA